MRRKRIKIPIYSGNLILYKCDNLKDIEKKYNLADCSDCDAITMHINGDYIVAFTDKISPGIIAHESLHVVSDLFGDIVATLDINNQEPQCYLLGWVVDQCHKFLDNN